MRTRLVALSPLLVVLLVLLAGCAGPGRLARPSDFPLHATDDRFFDLHWRLERDDRAATAVGLVEAARVNGIGEVLLELQGLDESGRVVSRGLGRTYGGMLEHFGDARPFTVRLRPSGRESRFALRVWSFTRHTGDGAGRTGGN